MHDVTNDVMITRASQPVFAPDSQLLSFSSSSFNILTMLRISFFSLHKEKKIYSLIHIFIFKLAFQ